MKNLISARRTPVLFASLAAAAFVALPAMAETASTPTSTPAPPAASMPAADNSAAQSVSTQILSADQQQAIGMLVKSYIAAHPEIVQDALDALDKRQKDAEADKARTTIKDNNATIFNSAHQVVLGNPQGNVTMVEFFDYNCAYCKRALPDMMSLLKRQSQSALRAQGIPGARRRLGRSRTCCGRGPHAGPDRQEIHRIPPEAARRPRRRRQSARACGGQGRRLRHGPHREGHGQSRSEDHHRRGHEACRRARS